MGTVLSNRHYTGKKNISELVLSISSYKQILNNVFTCLIFYHLTLPGLNEFRSMDGIFFRKVSNQEMFVLQNV